ncbi:hypothetical protein BJ138DRAFT_1097598 [Hygrophoropsis aurantiaca]|uniref:Uncharacterized protein n=1 Tax=Hygrophoropsis aurantiaca TaxID=72124 RepID=A0ACB8ASU4_9AGAM|nr:hypothetical protein BJ138DRAFT_1097598 [Hygrophoropsis aurantiaca]
MSDVSAEYLVLLDHLQIVKYCRVAPAALWVDLVWNKNISPFCLVNTLYIVARYFPLVGLITGTYDILGQNMDLLTCTGLNGTSDSLLFKRTLCLLHSHKKFKALLTVTYITACIILLSCTIRVMLFGYTDICTQQSSASKSASRDRWTAGTYVAIAFFELCETYGHMAFMTYLDVFLSGRDYDVISRRYKTSHGESGIS